MIEGARNFRLAGGIELLDEWSRSRRTVHKNLAYKALFAVTDGSVFLNYSVLQDAENPRGCFILIREDLLLKISYTDSDTFSIDYIGRLEDAPGLDASLEVTGNHDDRP